MARGMGGQSVSNVTHNLRGVDFPANKEDLKACARDNGAEQQVIQTLDKFEDREYDSMSDVMHAYGDQNGAESRNSRSSRDSEDEEARRR